MPDARQAEQDYSFWRRALAGEKVGGDTLPIHEGEIGCGFFRKRRSRAGAFDPVAIWRNGDGALVCLLNGREVNPDDLWTYCAPHPVSETHYRERMEAGKWWDEDDSVAESLQPLPAGHNQGDPVEALKDQIDAALKGVDDYAEVRDDAAAAKAQSLRSRLLELSRAADKEREAKKAPHLEAGKAVDALYQPMVKAAKGGADAISRAMSAYETARLVRERAEAAARAAQEAKETARHAPIGAGPEPVQAAPVAPVGTVKGAYGRAASKKVVRIAVVSDQDAAYAYFKAHPEVAEVIRGLAQKAVTAGLTVPGVEVKEEVKIV